MANGVNDDLVRRGLVENQVRIRGGGHPTDRRVVCAATDIRVEQKKVGNGLNAGLNPPRALWRMGGDVIEDRAEIGKSRQRVA
jgi:hypothetical protein